MKRKILSWLLIAAMTVSMIGMLPAAAAQPETIIKPTFASASVFSDGMAAVCTDDGLWGYINEQGKMVIAPKYDYALPFKNGIALAAYNDGTLNPDYDAVYILKSDGTEIALHDAAAYVFSADGSVRWDASGNAPLCFRKQYESFSSFENGYAGGVVRAVQRAYTAAGVLIRPKSYDGFTAAYESYQMLGPAVDGIIPCKALYNNREAYGQCFYMDTQGNVLHIFPSADNADAFPAELSVFAPDPETGRIVALDMLDKAADSSRYGVFQGAVDFRSHVNNEETWEPYMLSVNPGFINFRYDYDGSIFRHGYASIQLSEDKWALLRAEMGRSYYMTKRDPALEQFDGWTTEQRTFEALGQFGPGAQDEYCPVKENGHWHYVNTMGEDFQVEGPDGGAANLEIAGQFTNGYAPVYDADSGKAYIISAKPVNGILPMVKGTENLAMSVYFPDFKAGAGGYGAVHDVSEIYAITDSTGKIGFARIGAAEGGFVDVPANAFYAGPVAWAVEQGVTNGIDKTHFGPDQTCTRGQVVTFLWRANGSPAPEQTTTAFTDVGANAFYTKAVAWAVENEITSGTSKTTFSPDAGCTRGQVVTFLWRASGSPEPKSQDNPFTDVKSTAFYYKAVAWAVENKITNGMSKDTFGPDVTCTRGQIVTFLYRAMGE